MKQAKIFILSGPSGAGKTTILNNLFKEKHIKEKFLRTISFTTRAKRPKEIAGKDYFFIDKKTFLKLKKENFFLESQKVLGNYYGTPKYFYDNAKALDKSLILCIDVKGGMYLKNKFKLDTIVTLFVAAPTEDDLLARLKKRVEDEETIKKRIRLSKKEMQFLKHYDAVIVNRDLSESIRVLENILLKKAK